MSRLAAFAATSPERLARAIATATNEITRRNPAPRDLPFFGLDHPEGCRGKLLDRLSELGIFRFYEHVLDLSRGLGGPARWLARARGCSVVTILEHRDEALASRLLVERSHLTPAVDVICARFAEVPAADASFTHAWAVESLDRPEDEVFAELFRVVRPGGHVALQLSVARSAGEYAEGLRSAGFVQPRESVVTDLREGESSVAELARERVEELVADVPTAERPLTGGSVLVHVFAQKPA